MDGDSMRTMHVIGSRQEGGAERCFLRLTRALVASDQEVVAVMRPSSTLAHSLGQGVRRELVRMRSIFDPFARARIAAVARGYGVQIVQTYMGRATRLTRLEARPGGPVHVARVGGFHDVKSYGHAHAWIATTAGIGRYLVEQGLPKERVFIIRNPVDEPVARDPEVLRTLRERLDIPHQARVLLCTGRMHRDRGLDVFLEAFARIGPGADGAPVLALIVGDGPQRESLRELAQRLRIGPRVRWVIGPATPHPYLGLAEVFVYPSRESAVGTAVLEAWNNAVPVVATSAAGPSELVEHDVTGLLVPPEDPDALAGALSFALEAEPEWRDGLVAAARARVARDHAADAVAVAHVHVYRNLLGCAL